MTAPDTATSTVSTGTDTGSGHAVVVTDTAATVCHAPVCGEPVRGTVSLGGIRYGQYVTSAGSRCRSAAPTPQPSSITRRAAKQKPRRAAESPRLRLGIVRRPLVVVAVALRVPPPGPCATERNNNGRTRAGRGSASGRSARAPCAQCSQKKNPRLHPARWARTSLEANAQPAEKPWLVAHWQRHTATQKVVAREAKRLKRLYIESFSGSVQLHGPLRRRQTLQSPRSLRRPKQKPGRVAR